VRDLLPCVGFDTGRYKHPLTSIHSTLRRLLVTGEVVRNYQQPSAPRFPWAEYRPESSDESLRDRSKLVQPDIGKGREEEMWG
jgi:hypothetical protein